MDISTISSLSKLPPSISSTVMEASPLESNSTTCDDLHTATGGLSITYGSKQLPAFAILLRITAVGWGPNPVLKLIPTP